MKSKAPSNVDLGSYAKRLDEIDLDVEKLGKKKSYELSNIMSEIPSLEYTECSTLPKERSKLDIFKNYAWDKFLYPVLRPTKWKARIAAGLTLAYTTLSFVNPIGYTIQDRPSNLGPAERRNKAIVYDPFFHWPRHLVGAGETLYSIHRVTKKIYPEGFSVLNDLCLTFAGEISPDAGLIYFLTGLLIETGNLAKHGINNLRKWYHERQT